MSPAFTDLVYHGRSVITSDFDVVTALADHEALKAKVTF